MFDKNTAEMARLVRVALEPALVPGEELLGSFYATKKATFSAKIYAVGVTPQRLILLELDRKYQAKSDPITVRATDITKASIDGWGGGVSHFLSSMSAPEIRFDTADEKWKLIVLGGMTGEALMGEDYIHGLELTCQFIVDATARR